MVGLYSYDTIAAKRKSIEMKRKTCKKKCSNGRTRQGKFINGFFRKTAKRK